MGTIRLMSLIAKIIRMKITRFSSRIIPSLPDSTNFMCSSSTVGLFEKRHTVDYFFFVYASGNVQRRQKGGSERSENRSKYQE